jgi:L-aspartate oxidase
VLTKGHVLASASYEAQGGVAAAVGAGDSPAQHAEDTIAVGRGLCRESAVQVLTNDAPARIEELRGYGVRFDSGLGLEGGHSKRRVLHVNGAETGRRIAEVLAQHALSNGSIDVAERERVLAVSPGEGLRTESRELGATAVLLATGGYAALWSRTTNPPGSTGEGIELAYRAGAAVADLEFVQFHPTALEGGRFLLSEALRGEGALLVDEQGRRFTDELAPRDVVARAVAERGTALLDLRPIDRSRFPSLLQRLVEAGYDPSVDPVPVGAAAHYTMGGIVTDLHGRTEVAGLLAAGECACTGVHGANRLASNSLLECLVFGRRAALSWLCDPAPPRPVVPDPGLGTAVTDEIRDQVWEHAGLVRDAAGLEPLRSSPLLLARLLAESALARRESRGGHFRADFPLEDPELAGRHTVVRPGSQPVLERWS